MTANRVLPRGVADVQAALALAHALTDGCLRDVRTGFRVKAADDITHALLAGDPSVMAAIINAFGEAEAMEARAKAEERARVPLAGRVLAGKGASL